MRSLSLESIPVNKNMKLLILLVALFVRTNPSLSKPTINYHPIFHVIKIDLYKIGKDIDGLKQLLTVSTYFFALWQGRERDFVIFVILALVTLK